MRNGRQTLMVAIAWVIASGGSTEAQTSGEERLRGAALLLMGASLAVPGIATFCEKHVVSNPRLMSAAASWNKRHEDAMRLIVETVEATGGMTKAEREEADKLVYRHVKQMVQQDDGAICAVLEQAIKTGTLDLNKREDTADAYARLLSAAEK